jgi:hypothetical protein
VSAASSTEAAAAAKETFEATILEHVQAAVIVADDRLRVIFQTGRRCAESGNGAKAFSVNWRKALARR